MPWPAPYRPGAARAQAYGGRAGAGRRRTAPVAAGDSMWAPEIAEWDREVGQLLDELAAARAPVRDVLLPRTLTASQVVALAQDAEDFARSLARPMPRRPSSGRPARHRVPLLGRAPLRRQAAVRHRRARGRGGRGVARGRPGARGRARRAAGRVRPDAVRRSRAARRRGAVRAGRRRPVAARADRRGLPDCRRVRRRRLQDRSAPDQAGRRRVAAGDLPVGLGRHRRGAGRVGRRRLPLRPHRRAGAARRLPARTTWCGCCPAGTTSRPNPRRRRARRQLPSNGRRHRPTVP